MCNYLKNSSYNAWWLKKEVATIPSLNIQNGNFRGDLLQPYYKNQYCHLNVKKISDKEKMTM